MSTGGHRVIHGDCTVALRDLARDSFLVDAVVTDPPYHLASIVARLGSPDAAPIQSGATGAYLRSLRGMLEALNVGITRDLVDEAEGAESAPIIPTVERSAPVLETIN